jgi:hypothetical protein
MHAFTDLRSWSQLVCPLVEPTNHCRGDGMEGHGAKLTDTSEMEIRKSREISISSGNRS